VDQAWNKQTLKRGGNTTSDKTGFAAIQMGGGILGVKGSEDLSGGLKASYNIEIQPGIDENSGSWNRQSFVGLSGGFGALRIGKQYSQAFNNTVGVDPGGATGIAGNNAFVIQLAYLGVAGAGDSPLRQRNSMQYDLPEMLPGLKAGVTLVYGTEERTQCENALNKEPSDHVDWILVGCPNASVQELREVAEALEGKKVHKDVSLWVTTAGAMYAMAEQMGYVDTIKKAGGVVVRETCPFLARSRVIAPNKGYKTLTTNSAKMAFYAPGQFGLPAHYGNLSRVMQAAINGVWR
jgi:hypothetical protein